MQLDKAERSKADPSFGQPNDLKVKFNTCLHCYDKRNLKFKNQWSHTQTYPVDHTFGNYFFLNLNSKEETMYLQG